MSMFKAVGSVFRKYAVFKGRARRSEFWWFRLFDCLLIIAYREIFNICLMAYISGQLQVSYISFIGVSVMLFTVGVFALLLPNLAVTFRRLHDIGKSGAYAFLPILLAVVGAVIATMTSVKIFLCLPLIGGILLLVWECRDGNPYANAYGADPKGRESRNPIDAAPNADYK